MEKIKKTGQMFVCMVSALVALGIVFIYADANINHYTAYMDADAAAEALLAKEVWRNHYVQPDTWFISTGREIFAAARLAPFVYSLVGFNLNLAMGISCTLMVIALAGCILFFNREIGLKLHESMVMLILSLSLASPAGETQKMLYLYGVEYLGLFITMFLVMGIYARSLRMGKLSRLWIAIVPLVVMNGIQGLHASVFIFMPLLGTELLRRVVLAIKRTKEKCNSITIWAFIMAVIAFACAILWGASSAGSTTRNIRHAPEKFIEIVIPSLIRVFQIRRCQLLVVLIVILGVMGILVSLKHFSTDPQLWGVLVIPVELVVVLLSTTFTTTEVAPRYYLTQIFAVAIGTALLMHFLKYNVTVIISILVIIFGVHSFYTFDQVLIKNDQSNETTYMKMANWMIENGYEYGYSSFEHAGTMTVIANDSVKIRPINSFDKVQGAKWLSDATWFPPIKDDEGATCYIVSKPNLELFDVFVDREKPQMIEVKDFDDFVVYVLDKDYTYLDMEH